MRERAPKDSNLVWPLPHRQASQRSRRCRPPRSVALTGKEKADFKGTRWLLLKNPWNLNEESRRGAGDTGSLEHAAGAGLIPERILQIVLDLQAGAGASVELDELGQAIETGAVQEVL